jgi:hypothetical protein
LKPAFVPCMAVIDMLIYKGYVHIVHVSVVHGTIFDPHS